MVVTVADTFPPDKATDYAGTMDYLGYGRPILATDLPEIARIIRDNDVGLIVPDTVQELAEGILHLFTADLDELNQMGQNALRAVREKHSWQHRAQQILDTFAKHANGIICLYFRTCAPQ